MKTVLRPSYGDLGAILAELEAILAELEAILGRLGAAKTLCFLRLFNAFWI